MRRETFSLRQAVKRAISSVLKIKQFRNEKRELLEAVETYYRVMFLGEGWSEEE